MTAINLLHEDEPRDAHLISCAVWVSDDPCDCRDDNGEDPTPLAVQERATRGGTPPPITTTWENRKLPGGVHPEYRGRL